MASLCGGRQHPTPMHYGRYVETLWCVEKKKKVLQWIIQHLNREVMSLCYTLLQEVLPQLRQTVTSFELVVTWADPLSWIHKRPGMTGSEPVTTNHLPIG